MLGGENKGVTADALLAALLSAVGAGGNSTPVDVTVKLAATLRDLALRAGPGGDSTRTPEANRSS